jgi:nucleolar protein 4
VELALSKSNETSRKAIAESKQTRKVNAKKMDKESRKLARAERKKREAEKRKAKAEYKRNVRKRAKSMLEDGEHAHRAVVVQNIPSNATRSDLDKLLRRVGETEHVVFPSPESVPNATAARVVFPTQELADKCIQKLNHAQIKRNKIGVLPLHTRAIKLIVRNLPFSCSEKLLRRKFLPYGDVAQVHIPTKEDGTSRGFGFVQFKDYMEAMNALANMNGGRVRSRTIAVDWTLSKAHYKHALSQAPPPVEDAAPEPEQESEQADTTQDNDETMQETEQNNQNDSDSSDDDDDNDDNSQDQDDKEKSTGNGDGDDDDDDDEEAALSDSELEAMIERAESYRTKLHESNEKAEDVDEGRTVFIRNLPFDTNEAEVSTLFRRFGPIAYAKVVQDPVLQRSRGTAFVKFREAETAKRVVAMARGLDQVPENMTDEQLSIDDREAQQRLLAAQTGGIRIAGRLLNVNLAVSRTRATKLVEEHKNASTTTDVGPRSGRKNERIDKRRLHLARVGVMLPDGQFGEYLSAQDGARRLEAWTDKKKKLKNPNFQVSDTRISIRNLPLNMNEAGLRNLFVQAMVRARAADGKAGKKRGNASLGKVLQVKIARQSDRIDTRTGLGRSKRFGFVQFAKHSDALAAIREINNQTIATGGKPLSLIVEFALDDARKLLIRTRKLEKQALFHAKAKGGENATVLPAEERAKAKQEKLRRKRKARKERREVRKAERRAARAAKQAAASGDATASAAVDTDAKSNDTEMTTGDQKQNKKGQKNTQKRQQQQAGSNKRKQAPKSVKDDDTVGFKQHLKQKQRRKNPETDHFDELVETYKAKLFGSRKQGNDDQDSNEQNNARPRRANKWFE